MLRRYLQQHAPATLPRWGGKSLVVWGRNERSDRFSRWTGSAFSAPVILNPPWMPVATASWMGPDIASHGDTVYVVVKRIPESADSNRIFLFASFNGGVSFSNPVELGFIADSISRFPAVTTDATGNPIVAFMKFNSSFLIAAGLSCVPRIMVTRSPLIRRPAVGVARRGV